MAQNPDNPIAPTPALFTQLKGQTEITKTSYAMIFRMCLLGMEEGEIAAVFGMTEKDFRRRRQFDGVLNQVMLEGRTFADANVAGALYKLAVGYEQEVEKVVNTPGGLEHVRYTETVAPNMQAISFFLKNRRSATWKDKQEVKHEVALSWMDLVMQSVKGGPDTAKTIEVESREVPQELLEGQVQEVIGNSPAETEHQPGQPFAYPQTAMVDISEITHLALDVGMKR